ncbi:MAG: DUF420 domain-containing protein [Sphingobacteriales bacterium]|nr:MAG: DUF420 domain-containing protein [Sphingobacteriales bacterium]
MNSTLQAKSNTKAAIFIGVVALLVPALVVVLMLLPQANRPDGIDVSFLPTLHAILNSCTALALITGYYFIRNGNRQYHRYAMWTAFVLSAIFLTSYVIYHSVAPSTKYGGDGVLRYIYYFILLTHILLSMAIVPMVLFSIFYGITNQLARHRRLSRWTFPIWLYVAVTGVLVYILISPYYS